MSQRCHYCENHPRGRLKCEKLIRPNITRCRACRENEIQCYPSNVIIVDPRFAQPQARGPYTPARSNSARPIRRPFPFRAPSSTPGVEGTGMGMQSDQPLQERGVASVSDSVVAGYIRKILIALDIGSGNIKAAWKPVFDRRAQRALVDPLRHNCKPVVWENRQAHCPAQIAYKVVQGDDGHSHLRKTWGCNVDEELELGELVEWDVLKWVKPVIFNYEDKDSLSFHKGQLKQRLNRLKLRAEENDVPESEWRDIDELSIYSDLMGFAYDFVCEKIQDEFPRLRSVLNAGNSGSSEGVEIEVALPIPANSLPKHIKMVLAAAKRAGIPCPFPVTEPAAAVVYYLQEQMDTSTDQQLTSTRTVLLLDAGEGSLDATLCSVAPRTGLIPLEGTESAPPNPGETRPQDQYVLKEEVAGLTEWAGGSFANQACQEWLKNTFSDEFKEMLLSSANKKQYKTQAGIIDELLREFEEKKKRYPGSALNRADQLRLPIRGFPASRTNSNDGDHIVVNKATMVDFFAKQVDASVKLINEQVQRLQRKYQPLGQSRPVDLVILVGGANESKYVREAIKRQFVRNECSGLSGHIDVKLPQVERLSTLTAQGALLLLQDKYFIGDRILRLGYCVGLDVPTSLRRSTRDFVVAKDSEDGVVCKRDIAFFLLRMGQRIPYRFRTSMRLGWRALCMEPLANDTGFDRASDCFLIDETFYYCAQESKDGLHIFYAPNGLHEAGRVRFRLDRNLCQNFVETYRHKGKMYWRIEYEVVIEVIGLDMRYKMIIPETGVFEGAMLDGNGQRRNDITAEGILTWEDEGGLCIV